MNNNVNDDVKFNSTYEKCAHIQELYEKLQARMELIRLGLDTVWKHTKLDISNIVTNRTNGIKNDADELIKIAEELKEVCNTEVK